MAAGGERGVLSRTMHKNDFRKDSLVSFFVCSLFNTKIYRSPGTILKEEQAKKQKKRTYKKKEKQEIT